jgi:hypothetical protein
MHSWEEIDIMSSAILHTQLLDSPEAQKLLLDQPLRLDKSYLQHREVVEALAKCSYTLDAGYIMKNIAPLYRGFSKDNSPSASYLSRSLAFAIARDVSHVEVPKYIVPTSGEN